MHIPDFITHYNRGAPFRSMTSVSLDERAIVINGLNEKNAWGLSRFKDPDYLARRRVVENLLKAKFISKGGKPTLSNPIYFFLGRSRRFEEHKSNIGYTVSLRDLPAGSISFSYGDSLLAYNEEYRRQAGERYQNPLCTDLFSLEELQDLFSHRNFPKDAPLHIEAHLWMEPAQEIIRILGEE